MKAVLSSFLLCAHVSEIMDIENLALNSSLLYARFGAAAQYDR